MENLLHSTDMSPSFHCPYLRQTNSWHSWVITRVSYCSDATWSKCTVRQTMLILMCVGRVSFSSVSGGLVFLVDPPGCTCQRDSFPPDTGQHYRKPMQISLTGVLTNITAYPTYTHTAKHSFTAHMIMLSDPAVLNLNMHSQPRNVT